MQQIETLFDKAIAEIERMLNTRTVVGEPISVGDKTLIPLVNLGFGFGVGSTTGSAPEKASGGGTGGGGGVKPVALVVIDDQGVRLESIKSGTASVLEKVADTMGKAAMERGAAKQD